MTLEQFWTKQHQTMRKGKIKPQQPTDNTTMEIAQHGSEHDEDSEEAELEPGLAKALDLMTTKLMIAIDKKLNPFWQQSGILIRIRNPLMSRRCGNLFVTAVT